MYLLLKVEQSKVDEVVKSVETVSGVVSATVVRSRGYNIALLLSPTGEENEHDLSGFPVQSKKEILKEEYNRLVGK